MNATVAFVRAFPQTRTTLCSEVVAAWLAARGFPRMSRRVQLVTRGRFGTDGGADAIAKRLSAVQIAPADVRADDIVLVPGSDGGRVLGLHLGDGISIMAGFGAVHIGRFVIDRAWRLPA